MARRSDKARPRPGGDPRGAGKGRVGGRGVAGGSMQLVTDPETGETAELRRIQPYQATKAYVCPGCNQEIHAGTGHVVIVPLSDTTSRRHWHSPCWEHRGRRRPTGR